MKILGIDPGTEQSAYVIWDTETERIVDHGQLKNRDFRVEMYGINDQFKCVIEDVSFYGKVLNISTFETLKFIGRLQEIFWDRHTFVYFPDIAYHFCNSRRGVKTSNINAVLTARFGGKGTKKNPGKLYGIKEHEWSALAVAVYYADQM